MAFTLVQVGATLQIVSGSGTAATLVLPTGVTLSTSLTPRFTIFGGYVILVNSPSRPITIDGNGKVRVLTPTAPGGAIVLAAGAAGGLTGTYQAKQTYRVRDASNNIIAESDFGPASNSQAVTAQKLAISNIQLSADEITETELYRTATLGTVFFPWTAISGNTQTSAVDDISDAGLGLVAAAALGPAPDLTRAVTWKDRVFGVDRINIDTLRFTEAGKMYAWPGDNKFALPSAGQDARGLVGFAPRRDSLGIGKANLLCQLTGTDDTDFRITVLSQMCGVESQESVVVYRDTAYFLWQDGVYQWNANGIKCISDGEGGKGNVRSWFTTNSYFNRRQFSASFAIVDPIENRYKLFLCSAGSSVVDSWVEFDLQDKTWWGPHKTDAFTPSCALVRLTSNALTVPTIGDSTGYLWQAQAVRTDDSHTPIVFDVDTKREDMTDPRSEKVWGRVTIAQVAQAASVGGLTVTPSVGDLNATASDPMTADLTLPTQDLDRPGIGKTLKLNFHNETEAEDIQLLGFEVPVSTVGARL